ncbi:MAG TPA: FtsX-like permease family protein [Gammaproteobacteria bacterium]|nr:FtsX-like permease family protein [Gammaproteobacteria bacterium]
MRLVDAIQLAGSAIVTQRLRSALTATGIAVGIAAVVLLTSIGEGIHQFVISEFTQFGTNIVAINPGKTQTHGGSPGIFGTTRPLTIDDALALERAPFVEASVPFVQGNAEVEGAGRTRRASIYGVGPDFPEAFGFTTAVGRFLPHDDPDAPRALAVLGSKMKKELFGSRNPLGQRIRIGGSRYRVIGVMEAKGNVLGFDLDDTVYIPTARGLEMFNRDNLFEIDVVFREGTPVDQVEAFVRRVLIARHGREDFTITTQQQMLEVLGSVLNVLTFAVGALGGISLVVGGIGILTIMTIAVNERRAEIGLLRALGARHHQVLALFLGEAIVLSAIGGVLGLLLGAGGAQLLHAALPALPVKTPVGFVLLAEAIAISVGLLAGIIPARHAAHLDPVESLRTE